MKIIKLAIIMLAGSLIKLLKSTMIPLTRTKMHAAENSKSAYFNMLLIDEFNKFFLTRYFILKKMLKADRKLKR